MLRLALKMLSSGEFFKNFFNLHNFSQISFYSQTHFNNGLENHDKQPDSPLLLKSKENYSELCGPSPQETHPMPHSYPATPGSSLSTPPSHLQCTIFNHLSLGTDYFRRGECLGSWLEGTALWTLAAEAYPVSQPTQ